MGNKGENLHFLDMELEIKNTLQNILTYLSTQNLQIFQKIDIIKQK